jgi:hypothetical protein
MQAPKPWTHWTNKGTFKITPVMLGGSSHCELWFNDVRLGTYSYVFTAASSIGTGEHDQALGFAASKLGVPELARDWNGFK